jgi:hypothetical protein
MDSGRQGSSSRAMPHEKARIIITGDAPREGSWSQASWGSWRRIVDRGHDKDRGHKRHGRASLSAEPHYVRPVPHSATIWMSLPDAVLPVCTVHQIHQSTPVHQILLCCRPCFTAASSCISDVCLWAGAGTGASPTPLSRMPS